MNTSTHFNVCVVTEKTDKETGEVKTFWTKVGAAFPSFKEGEGYRVQITDGISVSGQLVVIPPKAKPDGDAE